MNVCADPRGHDSGVRDLILLYLAIKVGLILVALLGHQLLPFNWSLYHTNLVMDLQGLTDLFRPFNTWDTQHYLLLSQRGYGINPMSNAFFPLYPYLVWAYTPLFFDHGLIAAYVIANAFSLVIPVYLYKLCCLFWTREQAFRAAALQLAFPTAFFLSSAYSEPIYLGICLMAFYYLFQRDILKASVFCFLLPLARAQGLMFLAPISVMFLQSAFGKSGTSEGQVGRALRTFAPPAVATLLGIGTYFVFCRWQLGGYFDGLKAQHLYVADNSLGSVFMLNHWFKRNFIDITLHLHSYTTSMIDRGAFLVCAPLLIGVYKTQNKALFTYAALALLIPALSGNFMSYTRMLLMVFPLSIYLGTTTKRVELVAFPMLLLQGLLYLLHTGGYWVA